MPFNPAVARRRFVATLASAATALALMTATAMPVRADPDRDDVAKALAAIAVIALIAKAGEKNNRGDARRRNHDDEDEGRYNPRHGNRVLPAECAVRIDQRGRRDRVVYAERCLRQSGVNGRLPYYCSIETRSRGRSVTVFPQSCLEDAGFRIERGRKHW